MTTGTAAAGIGNNSRDLANARQFGRICNVTAWRQPATVGSFPPSFFDRLGNATVISDLRMSFNIEKHLGSEPNTCTISIFNLAQESRVSLCRKPLYIKIDAGYVDSGARNLFTGDLRFGNSIYKQPDWETKIQVSDGGRAYSNARTNRSFTSPVTIREVLKYAAGTMNLVLPPEVEQSPELQAALANGISMHGPTRDILTRLLAPFNYHWSIQNGTLTILRDEQTLSNQAIVISPQNGLIGSPERAAPDKPPAGGVVAVSNNLETNAKNSGSEITFECNLYPELTPGGTVQLSSSDISGTFKLIQVNHVGDTRGPDFKSVCKAIPR